MKDHEEDNTSAIIPRPTEESPSLRNKWPARSEVVELEPFDGFGPGDGEPKAIIRKKAYEIKYEKFLSELSESCNITRSARAAGLNRQTLYRKREEDLDFAQDWDRALEMGADALEDELRRRAMGFEAEKLDKNGNIKTLTQYSDVLGIFLMKGAKPEKYRERYEHTGNPMKPIGLIAVPAESLSDDELAAIASGQHDKTKKA